MLSAWSSRFIEILKLTKAGFTNYWIDVECNTNSLGHTACEGSKNCINFETVCRKMNYYEDYVKLLK